MSHNGCIIDFVIKSSFFTLRLIPNDDDVGGDDIIII